MDLNIFVFRLLCALAGGFLIGLERQLRLRNAGLAVNSLVAVGACLFVLTSETVIAAAVVNGGPVNNDNLRVLSQIVTGIGFLGAGVILKDGFNIHGLNSAATLWCSAAIGCLCGYGLWQEAAVGTSFILFINWFLKELERWIERKKRKSH